MAILQLDFLKTLFETYDKPTEQDFADLIDTLSTTIDIVPYTIVGSGDVWTIVNFTTTIVHSQKELTVIYHDGKTYLFDAPIGSYGLSGLNTVESNYVELVSSQFTDTEYTNIIESITGSITVTASTDLTEIEQGLYVAATYTATVNHEDVLITSIKLNGVTQPVTTGTTVVSSVSNIKVTTTYTLVVLYTRLGVPGTYTDVQTINAYVPQFAGSSATSDYDAAGVGTISLTKFIQSDSILEYNTTFTGQYSWFILNDDTANIFDQNGLQFADGVWAGDDYYNKKSGTITLADSSVAAVSLYRSATTLTSDGINFKFKSE